MWLVMSYVILILETFYVAEKICPLREVKSRGNNKMYMNSFYRILELSEEKKSKIKEITTLENKE